MKPLTPKEEKFAQLVASGNTQADALRGSYDCKNMLDKTIIEKASRLMAQNNISARVRQLQEELSNKALWTREESVQTLKRLIVDSDKGNEIVAAVKELNSMHGYNAPIKIDAELRATVNIYVPEQSEDE